MRVQLANNEEEGEREGSRLRGHSSQQVGGRQSGSTSTTAWHLSPSPAAPSEDPFPSFLPSFLSFFHTSFLPLCPSYLPPLPRPHHRQHIHSGHHSSGHALCRQRTGGRRRIFSLGSESVTVERSLIPPQSKALAMRKMGGGERGGLPS